MTLIRPRFWPRLTCGLVAFASLAGASLGLGHAASASTAAPVTWSTLNTPVSPPGVVGAASAYDADVGQMVLFGGTTATGALSGTTWLWDGTTWTAAPSVAAQPAARTLASMAFDPYRHQLILFGGEGAGGTLLDDTWAWNGASWYEFSDVSSGAPPPRAAAAFGYDGSRNLVLFGGMGSSAGSASSAAAPSVRSSVAVNDTWVWNGSRWTDTHTAASPPARAGAAVASGSGSHPMTLFGGSATPISVAGKTPSPLGDTWEWTGGTWAPQTPASSPPSRYAGIFSYDAAVNASVLFGGASTTGALDDTWAWDGKTWSALQVPKAPAARSGAAGQYDAASRQLVLFGGAGASRAPRSDTAVLTATAPVSLTPQSGAGTTTGGSAPTTGGSAGAPGSSTPSGASRISPLPPSATTAAPTAGPSNSPRKVHPGDVVILSGSGFEPGATIVITFHSAPLVVGTTSVAPNGTFSATVTVPAHASAGDHSFEAAGPGVNGHTVSQSTPVRVVAVSGSGATSSKEKLAMVGIALAIPGLSWLVLSVRTRVHRRGVART